jgi:hypothetical protein
MTRQTLLNFLLQQNTHNVNFNTKAILSDYKEQFSGTDTFNI